MFNQGADLLSKKDVMGFKAFVEHSFPLSSVQFCPLEIPLLWPMSRSLFDAVLSDSGIPVSDRDFLDVSDDDEASSLQVDEEVA